jgi:hypothetical protein
LKLTKQADVGWTEHAFDPDTSESHDGLPLGRDWVGRYLGTLRLVVKSGKGKATRWTILDE